MLSLNIENFDQIKSNDDKNLWIVKIWFDYLKFINKLIKFSSEKDCFNNF